METKRRVQWAAALVAMNGLLALATAPSTALANTCDPFVRCFVGCFTEAQAKAACQYFAPAGCVPTSSFCLPLGTVCPRSTTGITCKFD